MTLLLPFDTDDPLFTRGVEVGRLWELLKTGEEVRETVHATNAEMVIRLGEATGRDFETEEPFDGAWLRVFFPEGNPYESELSE
jgi:hypothetical protein